MSTLPQLPKYLWKIIQRGLVSVGKYDGPIDGIAGPKTRLGLDAFEHEDVYGQIKAVDASPSDPVQAFDQRTESNIKTLHPKVQAKAREFMSKALAAGYDVKIISGTRTYSEQTALYNQGRNGNPGKRVTNSPAGFSNHNFGVAFDVGLFHGASYIPESPAYKELGKIGKSIGFNWGGDWKSIVDEPHFEWPTGLTLAEMRERVAAGRDIF